MTTFFTIAFIAGIFTVAATQSSFYALRFLAGISWWGLGVWLIYNPLMAGANAVNDVMMILCFFGGFIVMVWMNWRTQNNNGREEGGFNFRIPRMFGGRSEEEEAEEGRRSTRTYRDRRELYNRRMVDATRGRGRR